MKRNYLPPIAVALCFFSWSLMAQIPTNGLIGFYPFSGNANDESGTGNNGTVHGATLTYDRCGNPNSAYSFDGVNDYISLDPSYITSNSRGTFAAWVKLNSLSSTQYLGCIADEQTIDYYISLLRFDPNYQRFSIFQRYPGLANIVIGSTPILADQYYFVVMTSNGIRWDLYVNGIRENLTVISGSNNGVWASGISSVDNWLLGCILILQPYDQAFLDGTLDDIRVYNRALTQEEILRLYTSVCAISDISGDNEVCRNQMDVPYSIQPLGQVSYSWNYSGTGVTIKGNADNVLLDFSANATSGTLSVTVSGDFFEQQTASINISVLPLPAPAGLIYGNAEICQGSQGEPYSVPYINNAIEYQWSYSGSGATWNGTNSKIYINFTEDATNGTLTVAGSNACGLGALSEELLIQLIFCNDTDLLNIPNSFSPNGDGTNDVFVIRDLPENSSLMVFNRAGKKLFEAANYQNDWDGRDQNSLMLESDSYWYVLRILGITAEFTGYIYLKR